MYAARMAAEARARGDEAKARYWDGIQAKVDEAPPLDAATRSRLAVLLRPEQPTHPVPQQRQSKALHSAAA